ncbi:MAG TPA: acyl-CoA dehydrogenase family protein [Thermoanaerobaculia bacterium]
MSASGISFGFSETEERLRHRVEAFAAAAVAPGAVARDRDARFDPGIWRQAAESGLTGIALPEAYGGGGASVVATCLALEALQRAGGDSGLSFAVAAHLILCAVPIWLHGTAEQKNRFLPDLCAGRSIGAYAATEPNAGSDATAVETTAVRREGGYEISGIKTFVTNGSLADVVVVLARTSAEPKPFGLGLTCFLVEPKRTPGVIVEEDLDPCGYRSCRVSRLRFDRAFVPESGRLGEEGRGFHRVALTCADWERSAMIAPVVGEMRRSFDACVEFALDRKAGGQPIAGLQMIQAIIAEMRGRLEAARWAVYRVAWLQDNALPRDVEGPLAKHLVAEGAMQNAVQAVQVFGGAGYLRGSPVERTLRDAKLAAIGGGTHEIQKLALASAVFRELQSSQHSRQYSRHGAARGAAPGMEPSTR